MHRTVDETPLTAAFSILEMVDVRSFCQCILLHTVMSHEQLVHDKINLFRLVRRLDKSISDEHWDAQNPSGNAYIHWVRTEGTLQVRLAPTATFSVDAIPLET
jgi:hypothetical protein